MMTEAILWKLNEKINRAMVPLYLPRFLVEDDTSKPANIKELMPYEDCELEDYICPEEGSELCWRLCDHVPCEHKNHFVMAAVDANGLEKPIPALLRILSRFQKSIADDTVSLCDVSRDLVVEGYRVFLSFPTIAAENMEKFDSILQTQHLRLSTAEESLRELIDFYPACQFMRMPVIRAALLPLRALVPDMCDDARVLLRLQRILLYNETNIHVALDNFVDDCNWLNDYIESWIEQRAVPQAEKSFEEHSGKRKRVTEAKEESETTA